jgi:hypothetical protein
MDATLELGSIGLGIEAGQTTHLLKFLEFYSNFSVFHTGIDKAHPFVNLNQPAAAQYKKIYREYRAMLAMKDKKAKEKLDGLGPIERTLGYQYIAVLRKIVLRELEYD